MKKFFSDFKKFISKGNILDMAVGVIIGGAFNAIVTAFTNKIIMPLINWVLYAISGGNDGLASTYTFLKRVEEIDTNGNVVADLTKSIYIDWGSFITAVLNFLIIAMTLFIIVKVAMKSNEFFKKTNETVKKSKLTKDDKKELKKRGVKLSDKKAVNAYKEEKAIAEKKKKEADEAAAKAKAEADRLANPTETDLLKEIVSLLKEKK